MTKRTAILLAGIFAVTTSGLAYAKGGASGGGLSGGMSSGHMSTQGFNNTNGPSATDRDLGQGRAEDRMSEDGLTHSKATSAKQKVHGK